MKQKKKKNAWSIDSYYHGKKRNIISQFRLLGVKLFPSILIIKAVTMSVDTCLLFPGWAYGDPIKLVYPTNSDGEICGVGSQT